MTYKLNRLSRSLRDGINVLSDRWDKGLRVVSTTLSRRAAADIPASLLLHERRHSSEPQHYGGLRQLFRDR